ncbi:MAG: hypothetical protein JW808_03125 [Victivallales bacterium]|nr:hypothetical protein [Victivallales bacterium]
MFNFVDKFTVPHFLLTLSEGHVCEARKNSCAHGGDERREFISSDGAGLAVEFSGFLPRPTIVEGGEAVVILLGSPIYDDTTVDPTSAAKALLNDFGTKTVLELLDGEFLAIRFDKYKGTLDVINDRWCSIAFHYYISPDRSMFCASPCFSSLWALLKNLGMLKLDQEALFEFLWFQRLFGTKTLARDVHFMPDAHELVVGSNGMSLRRYWTRNYEKNKNSLEFNAQYLADMVEESIRMKAPDDGARYGHFLSGGMDSRSVLAAFGDKPPACFTVGVSDNREVRTARNLTETMGAAHYFLQLHPEHYGMIREAAVKISGGMFNYDHALFLGYQDLVASLADVCFNGYGFDFMFQGMYIPSRNLRLAGRNLYLSKMTEPPENLADYFIGNASYRIKNADIWAFIKEPCKKDLAEFQHDSISRIIEQGKKLTHSRYDLWEYITFHHLSRHYSYPNVLSIKTSAEARILSLTNDIFDLYLSLPVKQRFEGKIEKKLLQILDPRLAAIPSANTGFPITACGIGQTFHQLYSAIRRRISRKGDYEAWTERTWPSREHALRNQQPLKNAALDIIRSDTLEQLDFLDVAKVRDQVPRWLDGENIPQISGDIVQTLTTMGTFLSPETLEF